MDKLSELFDRKGARQSKRCRVVFTSPAGAEVYSLWCFAAPPEGGKVVLSLVYDHEGLEVAAGWKASLDGAEHAVVAVAGKEITCALIPH